MSATANKWASRFPLATAAVSGLRVLTDVPNEASIGASLHAWEKLPGIRAVPMVMLDATFVANFSAADDYKRVQRLAAEIARSKAIKPLIIVVDADGPYVLEGGHRLVALGLLGVTAVPALVVIER